MICHRCNLAEVRPGSTCRYCLTRAPAGNGVTINVTDKPAKPGEIRVSLDRMMADTLRWWLRDTDVNGTMLVVELVAEGIGALHDDDKHAAECFGKASAWAELVKFARLWLWLDGSLPDDTSGGDQ